MPADVEGVKQKILAVFGEFKVGTGEYLPFQSLQSRTMNWNPPERKLVDEALKSLAEDGDIEFLDNPPGFKLTEQGESKVYP